MIEVKGLVKINEDGANAGVKAVNEISFTVDEGRFYTLLGPSGCGKTTTLRCIAGLEKANCGEILVAGQKVFSADENTYVPAYKRPIGMVFQSYRHLAALDGVRKRRISAARRQAENRRRRRQEEGRHRSRAG